MLSISLSNVREFYLKDIKALGYHPDRLPSTTEFS